MLFSETMVVVGLQLGLQFILGGLAFPESTYYL